MKSSRGRCFTLAVALASLQCVPPAAASDAEMAAGYDAEGSGQITGGIATLGHGLTGECTTIPFLGGGRQVARVGVVLGMYNNARAPQFGKEAEADYSSADGVMTVRFHPTTRYRSNLVDDPWFNDRYWVYTGLLSPRNAPNGCGYDGEAVMPRDGRRVHFRGEIQVVSGESSLPPELKPGNILMGGILTFNWPDTTQRILAVNNFSNGPNPPSLLGATFECDPNDWWYQLHWQDWWNEAYANTYHSFDIDLTAVAERAIRKSRSCRGGVDLGTAESIRIRDVFVGPEYAVGEGGQATFRARNLRIEIE